MPKSFDDYILLLKEMQNAKYKTGRDINNFKKSLQFTTACGNISKRNEENQ